ncbi:MAG: hypothetical protein HDT46_10600 [Ruminococcaceae bacterium]|nr:hypothetical protein [Oscillospiraceae bacterium]
MNSNKTIINYYHSSIQINGNIITYGNSFIQAKNISLITVAPIPASKSWVGALILLMLGFVLRLFTINGSAILGDIVIIASIIWIICFAIGEGRKGDNLVINLNSGNSLYFYCHNKEFLNQVVSVFISCINHKDTNPVTIMFDKCQIIGGNLFNNSNIG